ncbi:MAG: hypothetical protein JNK04_01820, partial [Myxococcales bacterium]|nr:hypothetical protein [Myxococcales bacterium]
MGDEPTGDGPQEGGAEPVATSGGGGGESRGGGAEGGGMSAPRIIDSGTLEVFVGITAGNSDPSEEGQAEAAQVWLLVTVTERGTGAPVTDAEVLLGPSGGAVPVPFDMYSLASYSLNVVGYEPQWELSIVRGSDRLEGVVLQGPSFSSATWTVGPEVGVVSWAPSGEANVSADLCALTTDVPPPYQQYPQACV